jgi:sRNA-binding carbon storage regulator CsrA
MSQERPRIAGISMDGELVLKDTIYIGIKAPKKEVVNISRDVYELVIQNDNHNSCENVLTALSKINIQYLDAIQFISIAIKQGFSIIKISEDKSKLEIDCETLKENGIDAYVELMPEDHKQIMVNQNKSNVR